MRVIVVIISLLFITPIYGQASYTLTRNDKAQVTRWELIGDTLKINNAPYAFERAYSGDNVIIGYVYKQIDNKKVRFKVRLEFIPNPLKTVKVYDKNNRLIENFEGYEEN